MAPVLASGVAGSVQATTEPDTGGAGSGTCLPEGGIEAKDSYLIGMSQANKGEPWRQAMNDQIEAAAEAHPELEVVFADAAQDNAQQVADVENFLAQGIDLLIISPNEAAPLTDVVAEACAAGRAGDRPRPQGRRRPVHDVDRRRQRADRRAGRGLRRAVLHRRRDTIPAR